METTVIEKAEVSAEKKPVKCPRCGTVHWLFPGDNVHCHGKTDSPYGSKGVCHLVIGRVADKD
jgi:hypothetical protein